MDRQRPYIQAPRLRGTKVYMTTGTGLPGKHENLADKGIVGDPITLVNQAVVGDHRGGGQPVHPGDGAATALP